MENRMFSINWLALMMLGIAAASGCGGGSGSGSEGVSDTRVMIDIYSAYLQEHNNRPPPSEQAFRTFVQQRQDRLEKAGMTIDQMFVSPRGSGELKWVYGDRLPADARGVTYLAYENAPADGKRLVFAPRGTTEMEETQFKTVFPNAD
jgi:hypothetical protein